MCLNDDLIESCRDPKSEFEKLLFCRIAVHSGLRYSERVLLINDGLFNSKNDWAEEQFKL